MLGGSSLIDIIEDIASCMRHIRRCQKRTLLTRDKRDDRDATRRTQVQNLKTASNAILFLSSSHVIAFHCFVMYMYGFVHPGTHDREVANANYIVQYMQLNFISYSPPFSIYTIVTMMRDWSPAPRHFCAAPSPLCSRCQARCGSFVAGIWR